MKPRDMVKALEPDDLTNGQAPVDAKGSSAVFLFPLRFLGMGLFISWLCCTHVTTIFPGGSDGPAFFRDAIDITMRYADIGAFLVLAVFASKIGSLSKHPAISTTAVLLTSAGTASLGLVVVLLEMPEAVIRLCSIPTAVGGSFLFCLWGEAYSQMGPIRVIVYGALSCIMAFLVFFVISTMFQPYAIIATSLLPLLSFACVMLSFKALSREQAIISGIRYPIPWRLFLLMAIAGFLSGLSGSLLPNLGGHGAIHRIQVTGLAGLTISIMVFALRERCDVRFLAKACLPMAFIAFAIIPFAGMGWGHFVSFFIKFSYVWFTFFVLMMLANLVYRFELPSLRLFAIARATSETAILIGILLRDLLRESDLLENSLLLYATTLAGLILLVVCVFIWTQERSVNADWGAAGVSIEDGLHIPGPREQLMQRRDTLAAEYNLTARETEILGLIAEQKTRAEIEQELFLSANTVKTHARNLYAKLKIHSKEDVFELFK